MRKYRVWHYSWLVLLVLVPMVACSGLIGAAEQAELADEQVLNVGLGDADRGPLDPHQPLQTPDTPVLNVIYEKLVGYKVPGDPTSGIQPELATSWESQENGKIWIFQLREGVKWHKGYGELTAEDVKFTYERVTDPDRSGVATQPPYSDLKSVEILDDYRVKFTFSKVYPDLLVKWARLTTGFGVLCKRAVEEKNVESNPIGTGPFVFEKYSPNERITVTKNPDYWQGEPTLDQVRFSYMPNLSSRTMAFLSGELDIIQGTYDQAWIERIESRSETAIADSLAPGYSAVFGFNLTKEPLDQWLVRAAIAYAVDRSQLVEAIGEDLSSKQYSVVPKGWLYHVEEGIPKYEYNPELSKKLLAAAGFPNGFKLSTYCSSSSSYYRDQFEVIQQQLKKVGIELELKMVDHSTFHAYQDKQDRNTLFLFGNGGYDGEKHLWNFWHSKSIITKGTGVLNISHYGDEVGSIDDILEAAQAKSPEVKQTLFARAQRQIINDLGAYPTIIMERVLARHDYVDLGYKTITHRTGSLYDINWKTKILAH